MSKIPEERIQRLNLCSNNPGGKFVLYWMDASLRQRNNSALEYAIELGAEYKKGVVVVYCLHTKGRLSSRRRARFALESLRELEKSLSARGIQLAVVFGTPQELIPSFSATACAVIMDCAYLREDRIIRNEIARTVSCACIQVEDNVVVPVETVSPHADYSAKSFRPKLAANLDRFLILPDRSVPAVSTLNVNLMKLDLSDFDRIEELLTFPYDVSPAGDFPGGEKMAEKRWRRFLKYGLSRYDQRRNPTACATSALSPYLSFGCISPVQILIQLREILKDDFWISCSDEQRELLPSNIAAFEDEILTRREIAINYVWYTPQYDTFEGLPRWAQRTLELRSVDDREYIFTFSEMKSGKTCDWYWNQAQLELVKFGWMPPHTRMYWGKQPLLWTREPAEAFRYALRLNDIYQLDGFSPGGFAGVGWCYGLHDLPFHARPIWGYIRPMTRHPKQPTDLSDHRSIRLRD
ncbi:MAG: deoxyribodipyrimidine photo-lyase [Thermoguttaceae bacterium]|nr:deoxyribodipyrimidine photo-lyase [Thermoguttaceae bacterium]